MFPSLWHDVGPVICYVSDRRAFGDRWNEALVERVATCARAGVHLIQIRERDLEARELAGVVARCVRAVEGTSARVIVNDRLDVALGAGAHGVHLPSSGAPAARVRREVPLTFLIGRSVHSSDEARDVARAGGVDYLIFGTVFSTASKPGAALAGVDGLRAACAAVSLPVLAIGGVTFERIDAVAGAGASGFAAIGLFQSHSGPDTGNTVQRASAAFDTLRPIQK